MARFVTSVLLSDTSDDSDAVARLEAGLDEYVDVWTPALHVTSRFELVSTLAELDDSIGDVALRFTDVAEASSVTFLAWRASGRFTRPAFLDDDQLIEPTGSVVHVSGAISMSFDAHGRVDQIRCYYDRLALIAQMLSPPRGVSAGV